MSALSRMDSTLVHSLNELPPEPRAANTQQQVKLAMVCNQAGDENWMLDNGQIVQRAFSCLVSPVPGDQVLYFECDNSELSRGIIISIVTRSYTEQRSERCQVGLPFNQALDIGAEQLSLTARKQLDLSSQGDANVHVPTGRLTLSARHLLHSIQDTLIQVCRQMLGRNEQCHMTSEQLNQVHARHHLMTADKDIRVDAERINMG